MSCCNLLMGSCNLFNYSVISFCYRNLTFYLISIYVVPMESSAKIRINILWSSWTCFHIIFGSGIPYTNIIFLCISIKLDPHGLISVKTVLTIQLERYSFS